ncbi:MAG: SAM-dependent DNA methyltransferase [Chitinophagaceae bacterium]|nr:SAM-dependent DNA methyltransferase [Chitinophagaceae bacterium]
MLRLTIYSFCSLGIPCENIYSLNSLDISNNKEILVDKFENKVRVILTNPPFGAEFSGNALLSYNIFRKWSTKIPRKIDSEILFIERYVDWLAKGGYCVSVVPDSILTNRGLFQDLRNGIHPHIELRAVISFPSETFRPQEHLQKTSAICFGKIIINQVRHILAFARI